MKSIQFVVIKCVLCFAMALILSVEASFAFSSANIPLDSPVYGYLEELRGMGLISGSSRDKTLDPTEAARLVQEA